MKIALIILVAAMLLAGCSRTADPRLVELETRIWMMESNQVEDEAELADLRDLTLKLVQGDRENTESILWLMKRAHSNAVSASLISQPRQPATVPPAVYRAIAADAAKRFPGDYSVQKTVIEDQIEAYLAIKR